MTSGKRSLTGNTCQSWELEYIDGTPNRILWLVGPFNFSTIIFIHVITLLCTHQLSVYCNMFGLCPQTWETPLHFACKYGNADIVEYLVSHPLTDIQRPNKYGETAAKVGHYTIANF